MLQLKANEVSKSNNKRNAIILRMFVCSSECIVCILSKGLYNVECKKEDAKEMLKRVGRIEISHK